MQKSDPQRSTFFPLYYKRKAYHACHGQEVGCKG